MAHGSEFLGLFRLVPIFDFLRALAQVKTVLVDVVNGEYGRCYIPRHESPIQASEAVAKNSNGRNQGALVIFVVEQIASADAHEPFSSARL
jgi:hypothetical protein